MPLIAIIGGPTASGKSAVALRWAQARGYEILSADSRQIYRGFAIGTGAPTRDEQVAVPHHLVGHVEGSEAFSPQRFRAEAQAIVMSRPEANFLVVGGTGLYLKQWLDPSGEDRGEVPSEVRTAAAREIADRGGAAVHAGLVEKDPGGMAGVAPQDLYRIQKRLENWLYTGRSYVRVVTETEPDPLFAGVPFVWFDPPRETLHRNIETRIRAMFANGWAEEVEALRAVFDPSTAPAFNALGYREIADALREGPNPADRTTREGLIQTILARTRQYAKKQTTFFRHQFDPARSRSAQSGPSARALRPEEALRKLESSNWDTKSLIQD
jgi:tRNA dimethylallyltransferase